MSANPALHAKITSTLLDVLDELAVLGDVRVDDADLHVARQRRAERDPAGEHVALRRHQRERRIGHARLLEQLLRARHQLRLADKGWRWANTFLTDMLTVCKMLCVDFDEIVAGALAR